MDVIFATLLVASTPVASSLECAEHAEMVSAIEQQAQTGTLIFSHGDCLAVKIYSGSPYTHVAAVVIEEEGVWVYESAAGIGVRRLSLDEYVHHMAPDELHVLQPCFDFRQNLSEVYTHQLRRQLGRPYSVTHHLSGKRAEGLHCAEYITDALAECEVLRVKNPVRVSPASLLEGLTVHEMYRETLTLSLQSKSSPTETGDTWCEQLWIDTKSCTVSCWESMRRKVFCR